MDEKKRKVEQERHQRISEMEDADDIEKMIERSGCAREYYALEECLAEYNRDWTKCQTAVLTLKKCNAKKTGT